MHSSSLIAPLWRLIEEAPNILELRTQKILHLDNVRSVVKNSFVINYERLADEPDLLHAMARNFGLQTKNFAITPEPNYLRAGGRRDERFAPKVYPPISATDLRFVDETLDWDVEHGIGYSSSDYRR